MDWGEAEWKGPPAETNRIHSVNNHLAEGESAVRDGDGLTARVVGETGATQPRGRGRSYFERGALLSGRYPTVNRHRTGDIYA